VQQVRGWRVALVSVAVAAALTTCTGDGREPAPTGPPRFDASLNDEYDIRPTGTYLINGATWKTAQAFSTGTGVLKPFLRVQDAAHDFNDQAGNEEGFNTDGARLMDQKNDPSTHSLALNNVPVVSIGGSFFRELIFDANEANSDPDANFSIDKFDLWLCDDVGAPTFDEQSDFDGNSNCALVYDLDDGPADATDDRVLATDASSKGSGSSFDYQILIPEGKFETAASAVGLDLSTCSYNGATAPSCGASLILNVKLGFKGGSFVVGSTFEEFSTLARPFVAVTKTATPSFTRRYNWVIAKSVDPTSIVLFEGQSQNATWTITVSPGDPAFTDAGAQVSGTINIANTSGAPVTINSVADAIPGGYPVIDPVCPGEPFPVTLANNASLVCTYSVAAPNANSGTQTNTATVAIEAALSANDPVEAAVFTGSADFDFANATPTEIDKNPPILDNYNSEGETTLGNAPHAPFVIPRTYTCDGDEGTFSNTARVNITNPPVDPTATATLTVDCLDVTVTKTADESRTDTYNWLIDKSVTPASWELFKGDQGTSAYTVTVTPNGVTPSGHSVSGVITVTGDPNAPVYIQQHITDAISPGGFTPAVTDCEDDGADVTTPLVVPYTLLAGHVLTCDYTQALPNSDTRTNTAEVVAKPTSSGTNKTFTGQEPVDFSGVTLTEVNKTVHVDDSYSGGPQDALVSDLVNPTVFNYDRTFACDADDGTHDNTATITETGDHASASVTVTCRSVSVTKDALASFRRDWNWDIVKSANFGGDPGSPPVPPVDLMPGQTLLVGYSVQVTRTDAEDSDWRVTGTIEVSQNHTTRAAVLNGLEDVVSPAINASVHDCEVNGSPVTLSFPFTLGVGETLTCQYDSDLPDATAGRTNTATATQQNHNYSSTLVETIGGTTDWTGSAGVVFGEPVKTDECATVDDSYDDGPGGAPDNIIICASQTFTYQRTILAPEGSCDDFNVDNTATVTPTDDPAESDSWRVPVDVQCPQGCTLTLGYWKTHNASFLGGAPLDANWLNLPAAEGSGFFTSALSTLTSYPIPGPNNSNTFTWFNVFWTAPKGNAYYSLSQQYMAAKLNILNGADPTAVVTAISDAEALFAVYTPAQIGAFKGNTLLRAQFISLAGTLGSYNEGSIGPGHCSEDATSLLALQ
jgi:hypothetical protein